MRRSKSTEFSVVAFSSFNALNFHYHNYDRTYREAGKIDTYKSESLVAKFESERKISDNLSFGYGSDYKYDWGEYATLTFTSQTKGHVNNLLWSFITWNPRFLYNGAFYPGFILFSEPSNSNIIEKVLSPKDAILHL